jgi:hypothetical protein
MRALGLAADAPAPHHRETAGTGPRQPGSRE